jgi:hypothetical protein
MKNEEVIVVVEQGLDEGSVQGYSCCYSFFMYLNGY